METLSDLLERAREKTGSDAATARALGVGANTLGNWKYGFGGPKDIQRAKLADMLGMSFENVSAIVNAEKAEGEEKTYWLKKLGTFATAAGVGAMSLVLVTLSAPNTAQASTNTESVYIMLNRIRRLGRKVKAHLRTWNVLQNSVCGLRIKAY